MYFTLYAAAFMEKDSKASTNMNKQKQVWLLTTEKQPGAGGMYSVQNRRGVYNRT